MSCQVAARAGPPQANDPQGAAPAQSPTKGLRLDVPEPYDQPLGSSFSQITSPGPQLDERSPDSCVYANKWDTDWTKTELGRIPSRRKQLPEAAEPTPPFNLWSIIKDFVGKDITHLSVPAHISEPTCELQRRAEGLQCSHLLDQAAGAPFQSRERLLLVAAYAVSIYSNLVRTTKPFKDLLHSTYELIYPEKGYRLIAEKVAHTPGTTVMLCEGRHWRFLAFDETHLEFSLQCYIRLKPVGIMSVTFDDGDIYEWNQVPIYIQGLVVGPVKLDHKGQSQVVCKANGNRVKLSVSNQGAFSRVWRGNMHQVSGVLIEDGKKVPNLEISGQWDQQLSVKHPDGSSQCLWQFQTPHSLDSRYQLTPHALELNETLPGMEGQLPPTDVRLRPDMQLLEAGYVGKANVVKDRLENKQRQVRHAREAQGLAPAKARWFEQLPPRSEEEMPRWRYKGGYWEARASGLWTDMPALYDVDGSLDGSKTHRSYSGKAREIVI